MELKVYTTEKQPGTFVIALIGSLDSNTYFQLAGRLDEVLASSPQTVIYDMQGLEYISSAGIREILRTIKALKPNGGKVLMTRMAPQIKKVFEIVRALPAQQIFASIEELDDYLDKIQQRQSSV
jgi:anti-sigma B factor antagonist